MTLTRDLDETAMLLREHLSPQELHVPLNYARLIAAEIDPGLELHVGDELVIQKNERHVVTLVAH